jgi:hypothetical protein
VETVALRGGWYSGGRSGRGYTRPQPYARGYIRTQSYSRGFAGSHPYLRSQYGVAGYYGRYGYQRYSRMTDSQPGYGSGSGYSPPAYDYPPPAYYPLEGWYDTPPYYCPIGLIIDSYTLPGGQRVESYSLGGGGASYAVVWPAPPAAPAPRPAAPDVTYPYDGGPANPVPLPGPDPEVIAPPRFHVLSAGRPSRFVYRAYGDAPGGDPSDEDRTITVKDGQGKKGRR